jgi:hypothetical protein
VFERFTEVYQVDLGELLRRRLDADLAAAIERWATSIDPTGCCFHYPGIPAPAVVPAIDNIKVRLIVVFMICCTSFHNLSTVLKCDIRTLLLQRTR